MNRKLNIKAAVLFFFFISGVAGLIYEVVWMKLLTVIIGSTVISISTVLVSVMGGLALGSFIAGRFIDKSRNPLRVFGFIELAIGLYCLSLPFIIPAAEPLFRSVYRNFHFSFYSFNILRFLVCGLILLIPATLMGAALPVVVRFFGDKKEKVGLTVGKLYAVNTFGAAAGCLGAGFILIPLIGVRLTLYSAALIELFIGILVIIISKKRNFVSIVSQQKEAVKQVLPEPSPAFLRIILAGFALSGFCALVYEVVWTRIFSLVIGSSVYAYSLILGAFILGIASGSIIFSRFVDRRKDTVRDLAFIQLGIGVSAALFIPLLGRLPVFMAGLISGLSSSFVLLKAAEFSIIFIMILVPGFLMGAAFPLVSKIYTVRMNRLGRSVGNVYASNTAGAILGSFSAGFILIPLIGMQNTIITAVSVNLFLAAIFFFLSQSLTGKKKFFAVSAPFLVILFAFRLPSWDETILTSGPFIYAPVHRSNAEIAGISLAEAMKLDEVIFHKEGMGSTVSVRKSSGGNISLQINGKTDASSKRDIETQIMSGHLPLLFHPDPGDVLIIGLGSGITLGSVLLHPAGKVDCVEVSKEVVEASSYFREDNYNALDDERVNLILEDGRTYLSMNDRKYDVISSQPSNPWISGMSNLFTEEYFILAAKRLKDGGIMGIWIQAYNMSPDDFKAVINTFHSVFPYVSLWEASESVDYLLTGSKEPVITDMEEISARFNRVKNDFKRIEIKDVSGFLGHFVTDESELKNYVKGSYINTDDNSRLEFSAPRYLHQKTHPALVRELSGYRKPPFALLSGMGKEDEDKMERISRAKSHLINGFLILAEGDETGAIKQLKSALELNPDEAAAKKNLQNLKEILFDRAREYRSTGNIEAAMPEYRKVISIDPGYTDAIIDLANIFDDLKNYEEAAEYYEKALAVDPENLRAYLDYGVSCARQGKYRLAKTNWEKALKLDPQNSEAKEFLKRLEK